MAVGMYESFATAHWFDAAAKSLWCDSATLQAWLDVEAALASAQAELGLIPASAARVIGGCARAEHFDLAQLARAIAFAQHPLVPVLHQLEALCGEPAAGYLHWGATTQNIFDTACALQMQRTHALVLAHLNAAIDALSALAQAHRALPQAGRTHGQQALPMTLGFKLALWIDELDRDRHRLQTRLRSCFTVSMGGAIGTHAAMGPLGPEVQTRVARILDLADCPIASRGSFDRPADYIAALGLLAGSAQKIAQDVVFLQRSEIGELSEAFHLGKVGSSTMAQKRNPSTALLLASLARMLRARVPLALEAMVRTDEGDSSATNVADVLQPEVAILAASLAASLAALAKGLVVNPAAIARHLDASRGMICAEAAMMRLSPQLGRHQAHELLYEAAQQAHSGDEPLLQALRARARARGIELSDEVAASLNPRAYLGASERITDETIARAASPLRVGPAAAPATHPGAR